MARIVDTIVRDAAGALGACAPHLRSPGGEVSSWIVEPAGMLNEASRGCFVTAALARFITAQVEALMKRVFPDGKYIYVHDFSRISGYEPRARRILTDWGISRRREVETIVVVTSPSNAIVRMGVSTAAAVLRARGVDIHVADSLAEVVRAHGIRPARI